MTVMPSLERESGQMILGSLPAGAAGEAPLIPVPGPDLAFSRADGYLCLAVVDAAGTGTSIVGEQVTGMITAEAALQTALSPPQEDPAGYPSMPSKRTPLQPAAPPDEIMLLAPRLEERRGAHGS